MRGKTLEEYSKESQKIFASSQEFEDEIIHSNNSPKQHSKMKDQTIFDEEIEKSREIRKIIINDDDTLKVGKRGSKSHLLEQKSLKGLNFSLYSKSKHIKNMLVQSKSANRKQDLFFLEGWRLISEALASKVTPMAIFYSRTRSLSKIASALSQTEEEEVNYLNTLPLYKTPYKSLQTWSSLETSPGVMGVFKLSEAIDLTQKKRDYAFPLTVILDNIRDPTNMGAIMRTIAAAGIENLLITKECCDPWDIKVLRSGCGAHFRIRMQNHVGWARIDSYFGENPLVYLADCSTRNYTDDHTIPSDEAAPSLEMLEHISFDRQESVPIHAVDDLGRAITLNEDYKDMNHLKLYKNVVLPIKAYDQVTYFESKEKEQHALIIGGETGLSNSAKKFAFMNDGTKILIPMSNGIESLNSAIATAIIVYEMRKQFQTINTKYEERAK